MLTQADSSHWSGVGIGPTKKNKEDKTMARSSVTRERVMVGLCAALLMGMLLLIGMIEQRDKFDATVDTVEEEVVTIIDELGNEWLYETTELCEGQDITIVVDNQGTLGYFDDDVIIRIIVEGKIIR